MFKSVRLMGIRVSTSKCLTFCLGLTFFTGCFIAILPLRTDKAVLPLATKHSAKPYILPNIGQKQRLAILVPFRDRFEELLEFVPHMHKFLVKQNIPFHIFVIQQTDANRFNRASLINAGFLQTKNDYDYIAMHDVDLLPLNDKLKYHYPNKSVAVHISTPETHPNPKYNYKNFIGGILILRRDDYELVNGMSNNYWGWGLEDDEFYLRLANAGVTVERPQNLGTGKDNTFRHMHDSFIRRRDQRKCYNQREVTRRRDHKTGLHTITYKLHNRHKITIDDLAATVLNVELICNKEETPWCQCPEPKKANSKVVSKV